MIDVDERVHLALVTSGFGVVWCGYSTGFEKGLSSSFSATTTLSAAFYRLPAFFLSSRLPAFQYTSLHPPPSPSGTSSSRLPIPGPDEPPEHHTEMCYSHSIEEDATESPWYSLSFIQHHRGHPVPRFSPWSPLLLSTTLPSPLSFIIAYAVLKGFYNILLSTIPGRSFQLLTYDARRFSQTMQECSSIFKKIRPSRSERTVKAFLCANNTDHAYVDAVKKRVSDNEDPLSTAISDFPKRGIIWSVVPTWAWNLVCRIDGANSAILIESWLRFAPR
ncbi:hypothetical protein BDP27DRAFT_1430698 [Rhodocollybia butyracea]|uniref:Uncharacterized protein n=1 Tax=Rhodocollybia butyracea TaxID=206335 RepID=A0A9P5P806_9AGAR|nr:hypothetical protein BDP27DRAFT_1430698 [Rhodocollybia butyracea]